MYTTIQLLYNTTRDSATYTVSGTTYLLSVLHFGLGLKKKTSMKKEKTKLHKADSIGGEGTVAEGGGAMIRYTSP